LSLFRSARTPSRTFATAAIAFALVAGVIAAKPSHAAPLEYHFLLDENGTTFGFGSLTIDGGALHGVGAEFFSPLHGLLSFDLTIHGIPFTMSEDQFFPTFPAAIFDDGAFVTFTYVGEHIDGPFFYLMTAGGDGGYEFNIVLGAGEIHDGTIVPVQLTSVPEPSALLVSFASLAAIGGLRRRKGARA